MQNVHFYVIKSGHRERVACQIAEKAVAQGHRVHVRVPDPQAAESLNTQMWTFRDQSFLPHSLGQSPSPHVKVTIHDEWLPQERDVLINLADDMPEEYESFSRVAEVVGPDDGTKTHGRARFRQYREHGVEPELHEITR